MALEVNCPNRETNLQMCPCPSEDCDLKGICCLCVQSHATKGEKTVCMGGAQRPAETRRLRGAREKCDNHQKNLEFCPCDYEPCSNQGTCCDCIRNHWGSTAYPAVACMS